MDLLEFFKKTLGEEEGQKAYDKIKGNAEYSLIVDEKAKPKWIPKERFDQVNTEKNDYKKQVTDRDAQISNLKEEYKDVDGLKDKLSTLEKDNKAQKETYEKQLNEISFSNALDKKLADFKVKDREVVMALLKKENLKLDGEDIIGLKDQLEGIKKDRDYLFEKEVPGTSSFKTGSVEHKPGEVKNFATELGKEKAAAMQTKGIADFIE
jgi:predicted nuclease with TOPRIM domain